MAINRIDFGKPWWILSWRGSELGYEVAATFDTRDEAMAYSKEHNGSH